MVIQKTIKTPNCIVRPMEIIDTHVFYGENKLLRFNYTLEDLMKARKIYEGQHNIRFIVISAYPKTNKNIADLVKDNPHLILGAYLQVQPRTDLPFEYTPPEELSVLLERDEIKGLKIITSLVKTPINSLLLKPYIKLAEERDIPLLFHCGATGTEYTSYEKNRDLIKKHPYLKVILAHFGGLNPSFIEGSLSLAKEFPNVYLNTAGMAGEVKRYETKTHRIPYVKERCTNIELRKRWLEVLREAMQDPVISYKILFGTDYPELAHELYPLNQLSTHDQQKIMDNSIRLFNPVIPTSL